MQPPYQPSGNKPARNDAELLVCGSRQSPPRCRRKRRRTIGDELDAKHVNWTWYAGAWHAALEDGRRPPAKVREAIYAPLTRRAAIPIFSRITSRSITTRRFDPATAGGQRAAHLKDYQDLLADIAAGRLPAVVFYKPQGNLNQHPGYASIAEGDAHIADLVAKLRAGPQWQRMVIVITYDEFGGAWDHVAPPQGDLLGPGARIPALIISPFAKHGTVDHTQYDTESILRLITRRFDLPVLPGITRRDAGACARTARRRWAI